MFVTIEGCDFVGKTRLAQNIITRLNRRDDPNKPVYLFEPGNTRRGESIKDVLKSTDLHPMTEFFLFMADRAEHVNRVIKPILENPNRTIICDRYVDSTFVYQGLAGIDEETISAAHNFFDCPVPNVTLLVVCSKETLWKRVRQESGRNKGNTIARWDVFEKQMPIQERFMERANKYPHRIKTVENGDHDFDITVDRAMKIIKETKVHVAS